MNLIFFLTKSRGKCYNSRKKVGREATRPYQKQSTFALTSESCFGIFILTHFLLKCQASFPNLTGSFSFTYLLYMRERFSAVGASCARDIARKP